MKELHLPFAALALAAVLAGCEGDAETADRIAEIGTISGILNGEERTWYLLEGPDGSQSRWEEEEAGILQVTLQGHPSPATDYDPDDFPPGLPFEAGTLLIVLSVDRDQSEGTPMELQVWYMESGTGLTSNYSSDYEGAATAELTSIDMVDGAVSFEGTLSATMPFRTLRGEPELDNVMVLQDAVFSGVVMQNEIQETF